MPIVEVEQQSPEWVQMRVGCATASRFADIVTKLKSGKYSAAREQYLMETLVGRLTGRAANHFCTDAMAWGVEQEPYAIAAYELDQNVTVEPGQFAYHPRLEWVAASADGLVGEDGLIEVKCLTTAKHIEILTSQEIPVDYMPQMLGEMACYERQWVDFCAFDSRLPKHLQLFIKRFHRDDSLIAALESEITAFLAEVEEKVAQLAKPGQNRLQTQASGIL